MERIRCFLLEPANRAQVYMRRYCSSFKDESQCSASDNDGFHHAQAYRQDEVITWHENEAHWDTSTLQPEPAHDDPLWPRMCACGYVFTEDDPYQRFVDVLYRRVDTGAEMILHDAPPGAMWFDRALDEIYTPQLGHVLVVNTPGGRWVVDSQASNCTMPEDRSQKRHHCWILHGSPPDVTVDKQEGETCAAGAGSIVCGSYHGFLRNGYLESA